MTDRPERRAAPRFEIFAQASLVSGKDGYLMAVRNVSADGAFLEGRVWDHPDLKPGVAIELVLSAVAPEMGDDEVINIHCRGQVIRIQIGTPARPGGFGITLEPATSDDFERLQLLLRQLAGGRLDVPVASAPL